MSVPMLTSSRAQIVAFGSWGSVCGYGGLYADRAEAERSLEKHRSDVASLPGSAYSDRQLVAVDEEGTCWHVDYDESDQLVVLGWVRGPGGYAARYTGDELAEITAE